MVSGTKEDDVAKISMSIYITNFLESLSAKELFHACKQYRHVVDSFIPTKRSKNGKRFGFVRFINVFNHERLVNNLCTVWINRYKLHANITRFQRHPVSENKFVNKVGVGVTKSHNHPLPKVNTKDNFSTWVDKSYMGAVKGDKQSEGGDPTVKEFTSLANLQVAIGNEGFAWIKIKYMGELWEENCYHSKRICIHMKSCRNVVDEFKIIHRGKIYWIRANETPGWVPDFTDDSDDNDQDELNTNEDGTDNHNLGRAGNDNLNDGAGNDSDVEGVSDTLFEEEGMAKKQVEGAKLAINGDNSKDPFNLYPLLNKNRAINGSENKPGSIKYPPGFTPTNTWKDENSTYVVEEKNCYGDEVNNGNMEEINDAASGSRMHNSAKEVRNDSSSSGHFKKSEIPRTGGSILKLLEEVVKVRHVMGYNMKGCMSNMAKIIGSQGAECNTPKLGCSGI
nr:nucleotide-binding alpha-beta plait domain-containing protein [Tanacetum cinerariifolium]